MNDNYLKHTLKMPGRVELRRLAVDECILNEMFRLGNFFMVPTLSKLPQFIFPYLILTEWTS